MNYARKWKKNEVFCTKWEIKICIYQDFFVSLQKILERAMKVKWSGLIDDFKGHIDGRHYARHIPGNSEEAAVCLKPELSKKTKKKKAAHPTCKSFGNYIAESKAILHDQERRAIWQAKYDEAKRKARKYNKPIQGRLCDFVRHHVSLALKEGREIE